MRSLSSWRPNDSCSNAPESEDDSVLKVSGKVFTPALYTPRQYFFLLKAFWESPADDFRGRSGHRFGGVTWPVTHTLSSSPVLPGRECLPSFFVLCPGRRPRALQAQLMKQPGLS